MGYNLKDEKEVAEYLKNLHIEYQFGCHKEKNPEVCHLLGDYAEVIQRDKKKACELYKMNCDEYSYGKSCTKYGGCNMMEKQYKKDIPTAYKYSKKACEQDDGKGCFQGGTIAIHEDNLLLESDKRAQVEAGINMLKKACNEKNVEPACFYLSGIYMHGKEEYVEKSFKEAYKVSLKSCEMGNPFACANVAQMHARGDGVQRNMELAETFRKRAEVLHKEMVESRPELKFGVGT